MPWKERSIVEERMRFVLRLKDGESMASLCREFGISRVTGYKIYDRYKECGLEGLTDRARTPYRYANKLPAQLEAMIVSMRREKPTWGARQCGGARRLHHWIRNCFGFLRPCNSRDQRGHAITYCVSRIFWWSRHSRAVAK